MKLVPVEQSDLTLPQVADLAQEGPVILTRNGKPFAAVRNLSRSDWESISLVENPRFRALIEESRRSFERHGGTRIEELRKELGLPVKPRNLVKKKSQR